MVTGATGDDMYMSNGGKYFARLVTEYVVRYLAINDASLKGIGNRTRLLQDFLEHEMLVLALLGILRAQFRFSNWSLDRIAVDIVNRNAFPGNVGDIALVQENKTLGNRQQRADVGCNEIFSDSDTNNQRHTRTGCDNSPGFPSAHNTQCIGAFYFFYRAPDCVQQVLALFNVMIVNLVNHDLGIGC